MIKIKIIIAVNIPSLCQVVDDIFSQLIFLIIWRLLTSSFTSDNVINFFLFFHGEATMFIFIFRSMFPISEIFYSSLVVYSLPYPNYVYKWTQDKRSCRMRIKIVFLHSLARKEEGKNFPHSSLPPLRSWIDIEIFTFFQVVWD